MSLPTMPAWLELVSGFPLVGISIYAAICAGRLTARGFGAQIERRIWSAVGLGVVAARLGYVWQFQDSYALRPWSVLMLNDGGWSVEWGWVATWLMALRHTVAHPGWKRPVAWATATGMTVWVSGAVALFVLSPDRQAVGLPALKLASTSGSSVDLRAFKGKPLVLNLWATWCPPCNREMPLLAQAQADHPEVEFVFVEEGDSRAQVLNWMASHGLSLRNAVLDPRQQAGAVLGQQAFPTTYFFDARGRLVGHRIGELSPAALADHLRFAGVQSP